MNGRQNDLCGMLWLNPATAKQSDVPQRIGARSLFSKARVLLQAIHSRRAFFQISGGNVYLDCRRPNAEIVRIKSSDEQIVQPVIQVDFAAPASYPLLDLIVCATIMIDRTL